jgi:GW (Gly-Tryp) dipeptide domain
MRNKLIALSSVIIILAVSCSKKDDSKEAALNPNVHKIAVQEVQQVNSYSYLRVKEGDREYWMAVTRGDFKSGQIWYYENAMEMKNFESKELKRKFDSIFFADALSPQPPAAPAQGTSSGPMGVTGQKAAPQKPVIQKENVSVEPAEGGVTIAKLYSDASSFAGKIVTIRGKVTKVNSGIMKKNWIHMQDGTSFGNDFDLTVTTDDVIYVGDVVTFRGSVSLNQDFGFGYSYKVLLTDAKKQ